MIHRKAGTKKTGIYVKNTAVCLCLSHISLFSPPLCLFSLFSIQTLTQDLQPLSLTFDLPVSLVPQTLPDAGSPLIQQVVQTLGVSVSFRAVPPHPQAQPGFYESCCTVWGLQGNAAAVKVSVRHFRDIYYSLYTFKYVMHIYIII